MNRMQAAMIHDPLRAPKHARTHTYTALPLVVFKVHGQNHIPHEYDCLWCCCCGGGGDGGDCDFNLESCHPCLWKFRRASNRILHGFSFDVVAHFVHSASGALWRNLFYFSFTQLVSRYTTVPHWIRLTKNQWLPEYHIQLLIYLEHVCISIFFVFNDNRLISWQCIRYRMLIRIQNCLWGLRWLNYIVSRSSHTIRFSSFVQYKFRTTTAFVSLWQKSIISVKMRGRKSCMKIYGDKLNKNRNS